jgi:hypothetical protein
MGGRAAVRAVESTHHTVASHEIHTLLHGAWLRSGLSHGHRLRQPESMGLHRGREPSCMRCYHERNVRPREFHIVDLVL